MSADGNMIKNTHAENNTLDNGSSCSSKKNLTGIEKHLHKTKENRKPARERFEAARRCIKKAFDEINNPFIKNIVQYHHGPLYKGEERCYPSDILPDQIPVYARICKLADIYDAMTPKRCYKEAFNQINAVTDIVRSYARKDMILQYILQSFIKGTGIYPPGSIVFLCNGQMGYVLDSKGPFIIPFTDTKGNGLSDMSEPINLSDSNLDEALKIDSRKSIKNPCEVYDLLPQYLRPEKAGSL